jgi:hypothetical protein
MNKEQWQEFVTEYNNINRLIELAFSSYTNCSSSYGCPCIDRVGENGVEINYGYYCCGEHSTEYAFIPYEFLDEEKAKKFGDYRLKQNRLEHERKENQLKAEQAAREEKERLQEVETFKKLRDKLVAEGRLPI